ncbi:MAG: hypothetical protein JOY96_02405 [Verrucomicrobia bacterium]|nr:hypothetical protein [Verrucomicrobiota bacterium]
MSDDDSGLCGNQIFAPWTDGLGRYARKIGNARSAADRKVVKVLDDRVDRLVRSSNRIAKAAALTLICLVVSSTDWRR